VSAKVTCPNCLWTVGVKKDGTLREHKRDGVRTARRCGGSGKPAVRKTRGRL
jgi:hypothetical protein